NTQGQYFFFRSTATIYKNIFQGRGFFFLAATGMDSRPAENTTHNPFFTMDQYFLGRRDLVVGATITNYIDQAVIGNIVDVPGDLIGMRLDHYFIILSRIDHPYSRTII